MSEYIPRLREELVAAAAREHAGQRRRVAVRPSRVALVVAVAAVAATFVLAVSAIEVADDEQPVGTLPSGTALSYRVAPAPGGDGAALAERAAEVLRARIAAAGIADAQVTVAGDRIGVDADSADRAPIAALAAPGVLGIYDWEASVLGPDGRPAPDDESVTGGQGAGQEASVSRYEAVMRAAKARGTQGPPAFWLVDDGAREVLAGPQVVARRADRRRLGARGRARGRGPGRRPRGAGGADRGPAAGTRSTTAPRSATRTSPTRARRVTR